MTKTQTSLTFSIVALFIVLVSNFIPMIYFSLVGLPLEEDISSDPIFSVAQITGTVALALFVGGIISTIYFYLKSRKSKS